MSKFHRKTPLLESLFKSFRPLAPQACNFIKKMLQHRCSPVKLSSFLRTPFLTEHLRWLLFSIQSKVTKCDSKSRVNKLNNLTHMYVWRSNKESLTCRIVPQVMSNWREMVGGSSSRTLRFGTWNVDSKSRVNKLNNLTHMYVWRSNKESLTCRIVPQVMSNWREMVGGSSSRTLRFGTWNVDFC